MKAFWINIFFYFFLNIVCFGENVILKDGQIFKGKLLYIDTKKFTLEINDKRIDFKISSIEYLIAEMKQANLDKYSTLIIKKVNNKQETVHLIKLTTSALYYKNISSSDLKLTKLSNLEKIELLQKENSTLSSNEYNLSSEKNLDIDSDINSLIEKIILHRTNTLVLNKEYKDEINSLAKLNPVIINNSDFYEKFWLRIYRYLTTDAETLVWNLIENYTEKEKSLNIVFNENIQKLNNKTLDSIKKSKIKKDFLKKLNDEIVTLRKNFYLRAKKIILTNE